MTVDEAMQVYTLAGSLAVLADEVKRLHAVLESCDQARLAAEAKVRHLQGGGCAPSGWRLQQITEREAELDRVQEILSRDEHMQIGMLDNERCYWRKRAEGSVVEVRHLRAELDRLMRCLRVKEELSSKRC